MMNINSQSGLLMQPAESRPGGGAWIYQATSLTVPNSDVQYFSSHQEEMVMEKMLDDW